MCFLPRLGCMLLYPVNNTWPSCRVLQSCFPTKYLCILWATCFTPRHWPPWCWFLHTLNFSICNLKPLHVPKTMQFLICGILMNRYQSPLSVCYRNTFTCKAYEGCAHHVYSEWKEGKQLILGKQTVLFWKLYNCVPCMGSLNTIYWYAPGSVLREAEIFTHFNGKVYRLKVCNSKVILVGLTLCLSLHLLFYLEHK